MFFSEHSVYVAMTWPEYSQNGDRLKSKQQYQKGDRPKPRQTKTANVKTVTEQQKDIQNGMK